MTNAFCLPRRRQPQRGAFTLVEIMIVVAIIALIAAMAVPSMARARTNAQRTRLLELVKTTADGFQMYAADNGVVPLQSPGVSLATSTPGQIPPGMKNYLPKNNTWTSTTDGTWHWLFWPNALPGFKGLIYLYNPNLSIDDITFIDQKLDDGNPNTGALISNGGQGLVYAVE